MFERWKFVARYLKFIEKNQNKNATWKFHSNSKFSFNSELYAIDMEINFLFRSKTVSKKENWQMNFAGLVDYIWFAKMKYKLLVKKCLEIVNITKQYFINYFVFPIKSFIDWTLLYWSGHFIFRNRKNHTVPNLVVDRWHLLRFCC